MRRFQRGQSIPFTHTFYDSSGDVTQPSSAHLTIAYPSTGFPYRSSGYETTTFAMTAQTSTYSAPLAFTATWASVSAFKGTVHWTIRASDLAQSVADGYFELRANPANISIASTSTA